MGTRSTFEDSISLFNQYSFLDVFGRVNVKLDQLEDDESVISSFIQEGELGGTPVEELRVLRYGPDARRLCYMPCEWMGCDASLNCLEGLITHVDRVHIKRREDHRRLRCNWLLCYEPKFRTMYAFSNHMAKHIVSKRYCMYQACDAVTAPDLMQAHIHSHHRSSSLKPLVMDLAVPRSPIIPQSWNTLNPQVVRGHDTARVPPSPSTSKGRFDPTMREVLGSTVCLDGRRGDDFDFLDRGHNLLLLDLELGQANLESRFNAETNMTKPHKRKDHDS